MTRRVALSALRIWLAASWALSSARCGDDWFSCNPRCRGGSGGRAQGRAGHAPFTVWTEGDAAGEFLQERRPELALLRDSHVHGGPEP